MEFLNEPVLPQTLPRVEEVRFTPLSPDYRKVLRWEWAITMLVLLFLLIFLVALIPKMQQSLLIGFLGAGWLLLAASWFLLMEKSFVSKGYAIREKDVIYRSGWIFQSTHTCPFNRIQHSTVTMGPLERKFGLARLVLYTAGSNEADMSIPGLTQPEAQSLKEWITKKIADEPAGEL
jgi:membrane protein YdbS with pleckstrin-like domain